MYCKYNFVCFSAHRLLPALDALKKRAVSYKDTARAKTKAGP